MAALDSQTLVPFPQTLRSSVAMEMQTARLEQDNSSSHHCSNGAVVLPGPGPSGVELEAVLDQNPSYVLQDSSAAATGECSGSVGGAECWPHFGVRRRGGGEVREGERELGPALASEGAEDGGSGGELPFSKQLITFSLFGKMPPKSSEFL